ncbi:hypothetical protein [Streptomyces sp. NPDC054787]
MALAVVVQHAHEVAAPADLRDAPVLSDAEAGELARLGSRIQ